MILLPILNKTFRVDLDIRYDGKGFYCDLSVLPHNHIFFIWFLFLKQMILFVLSLSSPIKVNNP